MVNEATAPHVLSSQIRESSRFLPFARSTIPRIIRNRTNRLARDTAVATPAPSISTPDAEGSWRNQRRNLSAGTRIYLHPSLPFKVSDAGRSYEIAKCYAGGEQGNPMLATARPVELPLPMALPAQAAIDRVGVTCHVPGEPALSRPWVQ